MNVITAPPLRGVVTPFRGVVRMTRLGVGHLVFTFIIGFAAINTGNNSLYIALSFMLATLLLSGIASKEGLKRLHLELVSVDEAWAGLPAWGTIRILNRSRIWSVRDLVIVSEDLEAPILVSLVPRRATVQVEGRFTFSSRGRVSFKTADLYTRYPFGLFLKKRIVSFVGEAIVYPALGNRTREPRRLGSNEGDVPHTGRLGHGTEIHAFREYSRGDSLRLIHWKKSAGMGRWIMKQTELEAGRSVSIAVDPVIPPGGSREEFEQMLVEATTLIHYAFELDLDVLVHVGAATLHGSGGAGREQIFEALALVEPAGDDVFRAYNPGTFVFSLRRGRAERTA